jgi:hypothetical protein
MQETLVLGAVDHLRNFRKKLCLEPDVVHKTAEAVVDICTHVEHEQTILVNFLHPVRASQAELKDAASRPA